MNYLPPLGVRVGRNLFMHAYSLADGHSAMKTLFNSVQWSVACIDNSLPSPEAFQPPKGYAIVSNVFSTVSGM